MVKKSAGILLYKFRNNCVEIFLVHPGGPYWKNKDLGAWSIPKGEFTEEEQPLDAAIREFNEENGIKLSGDFIELTPIKQKGGKIVYAWVNKSDIEQSIFSCKSKVSIEWPPKSGKIQSFPEVDKFEWFCLEEAKQKINPSQATLLDELIKYITV